VPATSAIGTLFYYVEITFATGGCALIVSDTAMVIINEIPVIDFAEITIYSEDPFNFNPNTVTGNTIPTGTQYTWITPTFSPTGAILGSFAEATPQSQISQTLENTGNTPIKVTYTITPATPNCVGNDFILEVTVNPSIKSNPIITNNSCFESNDGAISTTIVGGIPFESGNPYLISWSGPNRFTATSPSISNLEAGLYTLIIEDKEGYSITEEFTITQPNLLEITTNLEQNISCFQGNDGAIEVTVSGGTLPYTFNWSTTNGSGIDASTENQNNLTAGNYTLEIIDRNNCTTSTNFTLTEPQGLNIETIFKQDVLCFGAATGAIEINVTGGTPLEIAPGVFDYLYAWSGPGGFTSSSKDINALIAGSYTITITDALACTTNETVRIDQSPEIEISYTKTDVTCYGATDGSLEVTVMGGVAPYQITWSNLGNGFSQSNLSAGTYIATITDGNNCVEQVSITIEQPIFYIDPTVTPISCNGENDGAIDLNIIGGVAPITVTWNDDASAGIQRNNLAPGTYTVIIIDSGENLCPVEQTFIFTNPPPITVTSTVTDAIDCNIANSGRIDLDVSGGTPPYSFLWSTTETTEDIENLPAGDYAVEITDVNGCNTTRQYSIFRQDPIVITFEETTVTDCVSKIIQKQTEAKVTGGFLPYTYSWSAGNVSGPENNIMTTTQSGSYTLTITDANGCSESKSFLIDVPVFGTPDYSYSAFALTQYDLLSIEDPIQFTNLSTGNYSSIRWDFDDGSPTTNEENPIHTYDQVGTFTVTLTVVHEAGCTEIVKRTLTITQGYSLINPTAFTPNDDGYNDLIRPSARGFVELEMTIFNTWGAAVYSEKNSSLIGWDGTIKGLPAENGNYVMLVKGLTFYGKEIIKTTPLTLLK
jgi:gliding motility-associated-like protein